MLKFLTFVKLVKAIKLVFKCELNQFWAQQVLVLSHDFRWNISDCECDPFGFIIKTMVKFSSMRILYHLK